MIAKERSDAEQGAVLRRWFDENVLPTFADRVLPFDLSAARTLAAYRVPSTHRSTTPSFPPSQSLQRWPS